MGPASPACKHSHPQVPSTQKTQCSQLAGFTGLKTNKGKEAMLVVFLQTPASLCDLQIVVWSLRSLILPLMQWAQRTGIFRKYASVGYPLVRSLAAVPRSQRGRGKGTGHRHTQAKRRNHGERREELISLHRPLCFAFHWPTTRNLRAAGQH